MRIKKTTETTPRTSETVNVESNSTKDAYSCDYSNKRNTYSTDEMFTGKYWIDGKKIYRKVFKASNVTISAQTVISNINNLNIDELTLFKMTVKDKDGRRMPTYYLSSSDYAYPFITEDNDLAIRKGGNYPANPINYIIILEYTKTND